MLKSQQASVYGYIAINVSGGFRTPVSTGAGSFAKVTCKGYVGLTPATSQTLTLSNVSALIMLASGVQTSSADGVISSSGTNFTCNIVVPYQLNNANTSNQQLTIAFTAEATDPGIIQGSPPTFTGATHPGKTKQIIGIIPVPSSNGTTQTYNVQVYL